MKFVNVTDDVKSVEQAGRVMFLVDAGEETPELDDAAAAGLLLQGDVWHAVGDADRAAQLDALYQVHVDPAIAAILTHLGDVPRPRPRATKADWSTFLRPAAAAAGVNPGVVAELLDTLTNQQLAAAFAQPDPAAAAPADETPPGDAGDDTTGA